MLDLLNVCAAGKGEAVLHISETAAEEMLVLRYAARVNICFWWIWVASHGQHSAHIQTHLASKSDSVGIVQATQAVFLQSGDPGFLSLKGGRNKRPGPRQVGWCCGYSRSIAIEQKATETAAQLVGGLRRLVKSRLWNNMLVHLQGSYQIPFTVALQLRLKPVSWHWPSCPWMAQKLAGLHIPAEMNVSWSGLQEASSWRSLLTA